MTTPGDREAAVLDRIEALRRRRPRLLDEVVTSAHGALVVVSPDEAGAVLAALRSNSLTSFGGTRIVDMLVGDPLPRIC